MDEKIIVEKCAFCPDWTNICPKKYNENMTCRDCLLWEFVKCDGCVYAAECSIRKGDD